MIEFVKKLIMSHSGVSSKRLCGILGFIVIVCIMIIFPIFKIDTPNCMDTFIISIVSLLGVDSITGIFKKFNSVQ